MAMPSTVKLWTPTFLLVTTLSFLIGVIQLSISTTLTIFMVGTGQSAASAGLAVGIFSLAAMVGRPFSGVLIDRISKSRIFFMGAVFFGVGIAMMMQSDWLNHLPYLVLARVDLGIGVGTIILGVIARQWNLSAVFLTAVLLAAITLISSPFLLNRSAYDKGEY
ncbi:MAG: MFS transporter [Eubacteriales bacterium]|nr:MFS transporter [Eubacteriales bacterium]